MTEPIRDPTIRGKTIQFRWTEGPTKGMTHEHVFHADGTVEWHHAEPSQSAEAGKRTGQGKPPERAAYAAVAVADGAFLVSYLAWVHPDRGPELSGPAAYRVRVLREGVVPGARHLRGHEVDADGRRPA
jgi:hypothetical protein